MVLIMLHAAARIGEGILLDHGTGLVIGETAVVGNWVSLMQASIYILFMLSLVTRLLSRIAYVLFSTFFFPVSEVRPLNAFLVVGWLG